MKRNLKTHPKTGRLLHPVGYIKGRPIWPILGASPDDPDAGDPDPDADKGGDGDKGGDDSKGKTFTQAELNKIATKEKAEGKAAGERAVAESLGVSIEEAKKIIKASKDAEDAKKSDADKDRETAAAERAEAEKAKGEAAKEIHEARIERAFAAEKFGGDDEAMKRVRRMVSVETGATYDDVLADVQAVKKDFPALFEAKADDGKSGKPKAPVGSVKGTPKKPATGEDRFSVGQQRAREAVQKTRGYNPLAKKEPA
jgi:hypothetical protein